jgi:hypothetical protein
MGGGLNDFSVNSDLNNGGRRRDPVLVDRQIHPRWSARKFTQDFSGIGVPGIDSSAPFADARGGILGPRHQRSIDAAAL